MNRLENSFEALVRSLRQEFLLAPIVQAKKWQSTQAPQPIIEILNRSFSLTLGEDDLDYYREAIKPNLPWADRHFEEERISGEPINPGETWKIWPWSHSAARHLKGEQAPQYDHSYAERYWPIYAGTTPDGYLPSDPEHLVTLLRPGPSGIRFGIGDLNDLVQVLLDDPLTRQAYLPIWFPEDIHAARFGHRVPCTLGYHFIRRDPWFHIVYPMRSCDFIRHFRDDVYLTLRLMLWVLKECKNQDPGWLGIMPGSFRMHITSLHMFKTDHEAMKKEMGL